MPNTYVELDKVTASGTSTTRYEPLYLLQSSLAITVAFGYSFVYFSIVFF